MTCAELATELAHANLLRRPVLLTGDALALALRLARDEVEREADIDQLIRALAGALRDFDAGNGSMPREEIADALALAEAAAAEAKEDVEEVYRRGEAQGRADHAALTSAEVRHLRLRLAAAERVRRGARCLRERCRRLSAAMRKAQEMASHADAQAYAREAMAELAVSKLRELGVNVSMLSLWDELNGVYPPPHLQKGNR